MIAESASTVSLFIGMTGVDLIAVLVVAVDGTSPEMVRRLSSGVSEASVHSWVSGVSVKDINLLHRASLANVFSVKLRLFSYPSV